MDCFVLIFAALVLQVSAAPSMVTPPGREIIQATQNRNYDDYCDCKLKSECPQINEVGAGVDVTNRVSHCPENMVCCPSNSLDVSTEAYNTMCESLNKKQAFPDPRCCGRHSYKRSGEVPQDTIGDRIYHGNVTLPGQYPWLVRVFGQKKVCSGVLIGSGHVLTARHCAYGNPRPKLKVGLGCTDKEYCERRIKFSRQNNENGVNHLKHDIVILVLDEPAHFTNTVRPICLPNVNALLSAEEGEYAVAGWGQTERGFQKNIKKMHVDTQRMSTEECKQKVEEQCGKPNDNPFCESVRDLYRNNVKGSLICSGSENGASCVGDSGGPLMKRFYENNNTRYETAGVITNYLNEKQNCTEGNITNINIDILLHMEWIKNIMEDPSKLPRWMKTKEP